MNKLINEKKKKFNLLSFLFQLKTSNFFFLFSLFFFSFNYKITFIMVL